MRVSQKNGTKGSLKWIQKCVNKNPTPLNSKILSSLDLGKSCEINWLSPLKGDQFAEYSDLDFLKLLNLNLPNRKLTDFWPKRGPQWDALAQTSSGEEHGDAHANMRFVIFEKLNSQFKI